MRSLYYLIDGTIKIYSYKEAMKAKEEGHKVEEGLERIPEPKAKPYKGLYLSARSSK